MQCRFLGQGRVECHAIAGAHDADPVLADLITQVDYVWATCSRWLVLGRNGRSAQTKEPQDFLQVIFAQDAYLDQALDISKLVGQRHIGQCENKMIAMGVQTRSTSRKLDLRARSQPRTATSRRDEPPERRGPGRHPERSL